MHNYIDVPLEVSSDEIRNKEASWSASMFRQVKLPTSTTQRVGNLLEPHRPFDRGAEPGSLWYLDHSSKFFIRTKALQSNSYLLYPKGDAIIPINPKVFKPMRLSNGDILLSKDSNVGECAMIDGSRWQNHIFSGGIVRLNPVVDRFYLFAFLKHPLFKTQLLAMSPRGATITHAKSLWLDCLIPFPQQTNASLVITYISNLMKVIVEKGDRDSSATRSHKQTHYR